LSYRPGNVIRLGRWFQKQRLNHQHDRTGDEVDIGEVEDRPVKVGRRSLEEPEVQEIADGVNRGVVGVCPTVQTEPIIEVAEHPAHDKAQRDRQPFARRAFVNKHPTQDAEGGNHAQAGEEV